MIASISILLGISAVMVGLAGYVWRRRMATSGANAFIGLMLAIGLWSLAPWLGNILYLLHIIPNPSLDLTPFTFGIIGLTTGWAIIQLGLLDTRPVTRDISVESMVDVTVVLDARKRIVDLNPAAEKVFNLLSSQVIGKPAAQILDFLPGLIENFLALDKQERQIRLVISGTVYYFEVHPSRLSDRRGRLRGWLLLFIDISSRERSERRLKVQYEATKSLAESNCLAEAVPPILQAICDNLDFSIGEFWQVDDENHNLKLIELWHMPLVQVDEYEAFTRTLTYQKGIGLPGKTWEEGNAIWVEDINRLETCPGQEIAVKLGFHSAYAFPINIKNHVLGVMVFFCHQIFQPDSLVSLFDAIGSQVGLFIVTKQAVLALRESEFKYKSLYDQIPVGVYRSTREGRIIHANPAFAAILGYVSVSELIEHCHAPSVYIDPTDRTRKLEHLAISKDIFSQELHWITRDGRKIWVMDTVGAIFNPSGEIEYMDGTIEEITDRKKAELTLRESEQRYRLLFTDAQRQARELALQNQVRSELSRELDLQTIFRKVVEAISSTYGYTLVSIYLLQGDMLILQHQVGYEQVFQQIPITTGIVGRVARTGEAVLIKEVNAEQDFFEAIPGTNSQVCVPLLDAGRVVGILNAERAQSTPLTDTDLRMMIALAEHVSIAIERARLFTTARESESKFRNIVENSADGITLTDEQGRIIEWNLGQENISGLSRADVIGRPVWDVFYQMVCDEDRTIWSLAKIQNATLEILSTGKPMAQQNIQEFTIQRPNGERCTIQNVLSRIKGKGGFMMSSFSRDITESARLEQMKSDFINRAAHDLRTPLTTVTMMVDLIQEGGEENELKQYWLILNTELKRQQSLIEELLMIGRLESGRFTLQAKPLKLAPVLDESIQATLPLADNKSIEFNYFIAADLPIINANEASLQEVFVNLLNNAIKFTPVGGKVELNAVVQGNGVMVCVSDNGMGIPEEDLPQLFTRFFRGGNAIYNEIPGSGVGLYIVKSIVELLGGSIHVQSKINCGTTFQIWLPALKY